MTKEVFNPFKGQGPTAPIESAPEAHSAADSAPAVFNPFKASTPQQTPVETPEGFEVAPAGSPYAFVRRRKTGNEDRNQFVAGVATGVDQLQALGYGLESWLGDALDWESMRKHGLEGYKRNMEEASQNGLRVQRIEDIHGFGDFVDWSLGAIGQFTPTVASIIAGGGVGGLVARAAAKKVISKSVADQIKKGVVNEATKKGLRQIAKATAAGQIIGGAGASVGLETGSIAGELGERGHNDVAGEALGFGTAAGVIDALPIMRIAKRYGFMKPLRERLTKAVSNLKMPGRIAKEAATQAGLEGGTEALQSAIERAAVAFVEDNPDYLTSEEARSEYMNALAAGVLMGGVMGGPAGIRKPSPPAEGPSDEPEKDLDRGAFDAAAVIGDEEHEVGDTVDGRTVSAKTVKEVGGERDVEYQYDPAAGPGLPPEGDAPQRRNLNPNFDPSAPVRPVGAVRIDPEPERAPEPAAPAEGVGLGIDPTAAAREPVPVEQPAAAARMEDTAARAKAGKIDKRLGRDPYRGAVERVVSVLPAQDERGAKDVNPKIDDILTAIAKAGGLDREEAEAQGIDPEHFKDKPKLFGRPLFPKQGGKSFDAMAETLSQYGYMGGGPYSANDLLNKVSSGLSGESVFSDQVDGGALEAISLLEQAGEGQRPEKVRRAVDKALAGQRLGAQEQRIVRNLLDMVSEDRNAPETIEAARDQLRAARIARREASGALPPTSAYQGEPGRQGGSAPDPDDLFSVAEYDAGMGEDARTISEWAAIVRALGGDPDRIEAIQDRGSNVTNAQIVRDLVAYAKELDNESQGDTDRNEAAPDGAQEVSGESSERARPDDGGRKPADEGEGAGNRAQDQVKQEPPESQQTPAPAGVSGSDAPVLSDYTESDLAAREEARNAQQQAEKEADQKAQADAERDQFSLSGSDLPADKAAAQGQEDLLAGAKPPKDKGSAGPELAGGRSQEQETTAPAAADKGAGAAPLYIEDFTEKSIIVKGETKEHLDRIKGAIKARPLWNRKAKGWVFPKKREDEVRAALADLLEGGSQEAAPAEKPEQKKPREGWRKIGANAKGQTVWEDHNGARSVVESGVRITESVQFVPGVGAVVDDNARENRYKTKAELDGEKARHFDAGYKAAKNDEVRRLPASYVTGSNAENAKEWYRGWDAANLEEPAQDSGSGDTAGRIPGVSDADHERLQSTVDEARNTVDAPPYAAFKALGEKIAEAMAEGSREKLEQARDSVRRELPHHYEVLDDILEPDAPADESGSLVSTLYQRLRDGKPLASSKDLYAEAANAAGKRIDELTGAEKKSAQESFEAAMAKWARDEVAEGRGDRATFDALLQAYQEQPSLNIRTSTSVRNQAYSTPAPLAFLASRLAGIDGKTKVYEPTAGNGMLLIGADPKNATANELEGERVSNLGEIGFEPVQGDALTAIEDGRVKAKSADAVITNPPFGGLEATRVDGYKLTKIDHVIAARALEAMKDGGRATLIIGASKQAGNIGEADRIFFNWLYSHYNVVDHFEVDGDLYRRQGAAWPVRVITVAGRQESKRFSPESGTIDRLSDWEQIYERYERTQQQAEAVDTSVGHSDVEEGGANRPDQGRRDDEAGAAPRPDGKQDQPVRGGRGNAGGGRSGGQSAAESERAGGAVDERGDAGGADSGVGRNERASVDDRVGDGSDADAQPGAGGRRSGGPVPGAESGGAAGSDVDRPSDYGANNKLVSQERAEEIRAKLKAKLGRLNSGIDPELLALGTELAVFHVEAGSRKFVEFARAMVSDLGDGIRPYLKSLYAGARNWPGIDKQGMDDEAYVDRIFEDLGDRLGAGQRTSKTDGKGQGGGSRSSGKSGGKSTKAKDDGPQSGLGLEDAPAAEGKPAESKKPATKPSKNEAAANKFQTPYKPRSKGPVDDVLVPVNMMTPIQRALDAIEEAVGDIDRYVMDRLGYESEAELHDALMALQVDSVAAAIWQIEQGKGTIIADQTGIGKGRQAAAVIRYAERQGLTPVFVSVKADLFTDMHNDLADIGSTNIKPLLLNTDAFITSRDGKKLYRNKPSKHGRTVKEIIDTGSLPRGSNALFMTYSQVNQPNKKQQAVAALASRSIFVLDESHNAGGNSNTGEFMRAVLEESKGVAYLSATYAKRPDNMPLYFKTDMSKAVESMDDLIEATQNGGVQLQTVISSLLTEAGQLFRRERSYDGIEIKTVVDTGNRVQHEATSDRATEALRAIVSADRLFHELQVKAMDKQAKKEGKLVSGAGNKASSAGVDHTQFSAVVHNFVRQMLLGLKVDAAADMAIESLKKGEKPVIALENTMGSFLKAYVEQEGVRTGESLGDFDYRSVLTRALARTRRIKIKDGFGDESYRDVSIDELHPVVRGAYDDAQAIIEETQLDIPASPIDWIRHRIEQAGYTVKEITGRDFRVDYDGDEPVLAKIDPEEKNDKFKTRDGFNSGTVDALILNVAGSTGISIHASEKFPNQNKRHMIVAQPALDINIFMQMLGRIHRTGQVVLPRYSILNVDLPAEKRPTAVLSGKMKMLNANTSSNTESATSVETPDLLNKYGDQVVSQYLEDNDELRRELDVATGEGAPDVAKKATGRLALMPIQTQKDFYDEVETEYAALIEYLTKTGQNDLETQVLDLDAKEKGAQVIVEGKDPTNPFGQDAVLRTYDVKSLGKPPTAAEVQADMDAALNGKSPEEFAQALIDGKKAKEQGYRERIEERVASAEQELGKAKTDKQKEKAQARIAAIRQEAALLDERASSFQTMARQTLLIGRRLSLKINDETLIGVVVNVQDKAKEKSTGSPYANSKTHVTFMLNSGVRRITLPVSRIFGEDGVYNGMYPASQSLEDIFDKAASRVEREERQIITGNLLAAFAETDRGHIVSFTDSNGDVQQGILLPRNFEAEEDLRGDVSMRYPGAVREFLSEQQHVEDVARFGVASRDGTLRITPKGNNAYLIRAPKSKARGGRWFLDQNLTGITGDFVSKGNMMEVSVDGATLDKAVEHILGKTGIFALPSMAETAKRYVDRWKGGRRSVSKKPAAGGFSVSGALEVVRKVTGAWADRPDVIVVDSGQELPEHLRAGLSDSDLASTEGAYDTETGAVWIIAGNLTDEASVARVLMHEILGHYGLRRTFGQEITPLLRQVYLAYGRKGLQEIADRYGLDLGNATDRLIAAEEKLAEIAETGERPKLLQRLVAFLNQWIRKLVPSLKLSDAEVKAMMAKVADTVKKGAVAPAPVQAPGWAKALGSIARLTGAQREEALREFVGVDGDQVFYHGTGRADLTAFDPEQFDPSSHYGPGVYLSDDPFVAGTFADARADRGAAGVVMLYHGVKNPLNLDEPAPTELVQAARELGVDVEDGASGQAAYRLLTDRFGGNKAFTNAYLESQGFDGLTHTSTHVGIGREYKAVVAFDPSAVKAVSASEFNRMHGSILRSVVAFHGSPHEFERFSTQHIGSGEGAAAYGWGLYFASRKEVAEFYRDTLAQRQNDIRDMAAELGIELNAGGRGAVHRHAQEDIPAEQAARRVQYANTAARSIPLADLTKLIGRVRGAKGRLYEVELAPKPDEYLDWDKPLSEQSEKVQDGLKRALAGLGKSSDKVHVDMVRGMIRGNGVGGAVYKAITAGFENDFGNGRKEASELLLKSGIPGIRYLDGSSRGKGEGAHNYVIFSDSHVTTRARYSRRHADVPGADQRAIIEDAKDGQPIDKIFRAPIQALGVDKLTKAGHKKLVKAITEAKFKPDGSMAWMNPFIETARAGLLDRYGLDEEYKRRDMEREADERRIALKGAEIVQRLMDSGVDTNEAKVLQAILTGEEVADSAWEKVAEPIREAIDELGMEAVELGLLDRATFEKHRGTYLHRVYRKHEADKDGLGGWASKAMEKRRKRIAGNTLKQRGMELKVSEAKLTKLMPEWFGSKKREGKADPSLAGREFVVLDRVQAVGQGTEAIEGAGKGGRKPRVLERVYWPADKPVPAKYGAWENRGTWTVRDSKGGQLVLWRDFTKEERLNMGEILDARYTIAKTFHLMATDLANGRFLKDIAENPDWTWQEEGEPEGVIGEPGHRWSTYTRFDWVKVPEGAIPGTKGKKRWGALSGKYVRAEVWRDLNELYAMQRPRTWQKILTQWKLNKTARSPVVHMNNVMSNFLFMDMADVRWRDLRRGLHAIRHKTGDYQNAQEHGAFGGGFVMQEIKRDVLDPILDEILAQNQDHKGWFERKIGESGALVDALTKLVMKADKKMVNLYQLEDEVFRMATYMRRIGMGDPPEVAAQVARDQFLNYDIRAPFVNVARSTMLPFIAYTYRAVPVIARALAERPWKLAKYATIAHLANMIGYMLAPGDEDEERRSLRDEVQGDTWIPGVPRMIRMAWRDENGNPVFMDIRRWIPAGDVFDMHQGQSALPMPAWLQFGGPLMLAGEFLLNKTAFTGDEIVNRDTDTLGEQASKTAGWFYKSWMPSAPYIPESWYWDKIGRSLRGGRDVLGRHYDLGYALSSSVGVKVAPHDVKLNLYWKMRELQGQKRELESELWVLSSDKRRDLIGPDEFKSERERIVRKLKALAERQKELAGQ